MASRPRAKFWLDVIEEMKKPLPSYVFGKHFQVMMSTGPLMLSRVARNTKTVISVIPRKLVMPCSICNLNCSTCESYLRPLEGSSWISYDTMFYNFWLCHWKTVIAFILCLLLLLFLAWIIYKTGISKDSIYPFDFIHST
jgi:mannosyltransferase OCH1-like enzyme